MTMMYQCDLSIGSRKTRAYIDEKGAKVGARFRLTDSDNDQEYWTVDSVPDRGIEKKEFSELQRVNRGWEKTNY